MADDPRLDSQPTRDQQYVSSQTLPGRRTNGELPWYSLFRVPLSQLVLLGTILISLTGMYFKVQLHAEEIAALKATSQTKEAAEANAKQIMQKLDDLKERLDRIEDRQQQMLDWNRRNSRRP